MIPTAYILRWREFAPWGLEDQVEQDLVLSRVLIELFSDPLLGRELAFRGGTALHKLYVHPPARYSEDIDLVRTNVGPIGGVIHAIRNKLDSWLGEPATKRNQGRFTLVYHFMAETTATRMKVKIEINTREHNALFQLCHKKLNIDNDWFSGKADITTYSLEELMGTKFRAFYQRKKARDLFDLFWVLENFHDLKINQVLESFHHYLQQQNLKISKAEFEKNLYEKLQDKIFIGDLSPLLNVDTFRHKLDLVRASAEVYDALIQKLPGASWKRQEQLLDVLKAKA
ncbi:MAG: nucleotidyl transferase AbiEii/AbiGii toxin family protein [Gammaproteobacteria bacterium]